MFPNIYREMATHGRMSIEQLSKQIDMKPRTMSNKLNGRTQFNLDEMLKIQEVFDGIPLDELFVKENRTA